MRHIGNTEKLINGVTDENDDRAFLGVSPLRNRSAALLTLSKACVTVYDCSVFLYIEL